MSILWYAGILFAFLCFLLLLHWRWNKNSTIINWPVIGMVPGVLLNAQHIHEFVTGVLKHHGGTFEFKGPWFIATNFLMTSDPSNIHHILSKNFSNYEKGPEFREIFEPLGDGIISSDSDWWRYQRKVLQSMIKNSKFELFLEKVSRGMVEKGLIPILDHVSSLGIEVDLQDVFQRYTFDTVCLMVLGVDLNSLSLELPEVTYLKAFEQLEKSVFYRHITPKLCWKFQRSLQIGQEKKLSKAWKTFDQFLYQCISAKREELSRSRIKKTEDSKFDLLTAYIEHEEDGQMDVFPQSNTFIRDTAFTLMVAGKETVGSGLTWLLWLVATHASVEAKILEEINEQLPGNNENRRVFSVDELSKLVYLHAAICESLRLFPSIPLEHLHAVGSDILPSGHSINSNTRLLYSIYSMGRMESIWGKDCLEFKPERWISEEGQIVHFPSYKFITFNAGPRSCVGKHITFTLMKMVATSILLNYRVDVVEGHPIMPSISVVLHMKHGLKVRISKRRI